jgi:hypothetical protein
MFIHEAVKEAMENGKSLRRKVWRQCGWEDESERFKLTPTRMDSPFMTFAMGKYWNPCVEDVVADDWEVVE